MPSIYNAYKQIYVYLILHGRCVLTKSDNFVILFRHLNQTKYNKISHALERYMFFSYILIFLFVFEWILFYWPVWRLVSPTLSTGHAILAIAECLNIPSPPWHDQFLRSNWVKSAGLITNMHMNVVWEPPAFVLKYPFLCIVWVYIMYKFYEWVYIFIPSLTGLAYGPPGDTKFIY